MQIIKLSGKPINIDGLTLTEKEFTAFFEKQKPWKDMQPVVRAKALKDDYKIYKKNVKKEGAI